MITSHFRSLLTTLVQCLIYLSVYIMPFYQYKTLRSSLPWGSKSPPTWRDQATIFHQVTMASEVLTLIQAERSWSYKSIHPSTNAIGKKRRSYCDIPKRDMLLKLAAPWHPVYEYHKQGRDKGATLATKDQMQCVWLCSENMDTTPTLVIQQPDDLEHQYPILP